MMIMSSLNSENPSASTSVAGSTEGLDAVPVETRRLPLWHLPALDRDEEAKKRVYQEEYQNGYDDGFKMGKEAGLKAASAEANEATRCFSAVMNSVNQALKSHDVRIAEQLAELAGEIAVAVIRAELSIRPEHLVDVLQHLVGQLPGNHERVELRLCATDVELVSARLDAFGLVPGMSWQVTPDPGLEVGDCLLITKDSVLEATIRDQVAAVVNELMENSE
ncbi:MAG: flagellar assembly protein FliH [Candidatus Azotimanducaceae bacterium]|jgi:flagellar assembly protein FliH